ncbi:MAG: helix-turn-helix domain-containing protein [Alphaproteobacteria bacterium]|nr:helix-turn-helix domain-containing protein [Alphaproteobacteria bacterium]
MTDFADIEELDLPDNPTIEGLTMLIGEEALAQLSIDFGGSRMTIPLKPGEHSPIAHSIGLRNAQRLSAVWGGLQLEVPLALGRKERILRLHAQGMNNNQIARVTNLSRPYIRSVINAAAENDQLDLL